MNEVITIKRRLEKFGFSKKQVEIYVLLLRQGNLRISEIVRLTQLPRSSVYESLKGLFELGLAEEIIENSFKVIQAHPVGSIRHNLDEQSESLRKKIDGLDSLGKALEVLPAIKLQQPVTIRYYKGRAGARQLFWNTLKTKGTIYVQSEWGRSRYVGIEFYKKFVAESFERGFSEQVLTNSVPRVLDSIKEHLHAPLSRTELPNIRYFKESEISFRGETFIYDSTYAHVFLKDEVINGFEIESRQFVETQRAIFEKLWDTATPVEQLL